MRRGGAKWHGTPPGAINASVADMELPTPDVAVEAMVAEARRGGGYPAPATSRAPLEAAAAWHQRHGLSLDPDRSLPIGSISAAVAHSLNTLTAPGDGVVRVRPTYPPLVDAITATGRRDVPVDLLPTPTAAPWQLDLDALDRACADATALLWVAPHNPTGRVWTTDEVVAVAETAARHGCTVLSDEVWADVLLGGASHVPFASVAAEVDHELAARTVTIVGTSKAWNLASAGAAVLHAGSRQQFARLHGPGHVPLVATPPRTALAAATAVWEQGAAWLQDTLQLLRDNVEHAITAWDEVLGPGAVTRTEGTYLVWVDLRDREAGPMQLLAVPDGVVPSDGAAFGAPGFARFNLATTAEEAATITARVATLLG